MSGLFANPEYGFFRIAANLAQLHGYVFIMPIVTSVDSFFSGFVWQTNLLFCYL